MSLERIFKALVSLGLSQTDARVYIYLATKGPKKARDIINNLTINKRQIYRSLKRLQNKAVIIVNDEHPAEFSAIAFEEALDLLIKFKKEQAQAVHETKKEILSSWLTIMKKNSEN